LYYSIFISSRAATIWAVGRMASGAGLSIPPPAKLNKSNRTPPQKRPITIS
jgi:hypothetical protein